MFQSALIPVNLREPVWLIKSLTNFLCNFDTKRILLVHVVSSGLESAHRAQKHLEHLAEEVVSDRYETSIVIRSGSPALEICRVAEERSAHFIAMPWQRKSFLQRTLLGSTSQDVVRLADLPVFIYKHGGHSTANGRLKSILYATTFNPLHDRIIPYLRYEGLTAQSLYLLHVGMRAPDPEAERRRLQFIYTRLEQFRDACADAFDAIVSVTLTGNPRNEIVRAANEHGVELIVLGKQEQERGLEKALGSNAEATVHKSRCSILIIPAAGVSEGG